MDKINHTGVKVSIGIDVHLRRYVVSCVVNGTLVKRASMPAEPSVMAQFINRYFEGAEVYTAYEAGFSGFGLHRELKKHGINNIVVHAAAVEVSAHDRVKTDKRDSLKIATQLDCGRLKGIRIPSEAEEARRVIYRTRQQLRAKCTAGKNQIRMRLYQFGVKVTEPKERMTVDKLRECLSANTQLPIEVVKSIEVLIEVWEALDRQIRCLDVELKEQAKSDPLENTYRSVPGIGPLSARVLSCELGDMSQFSNERALFSFTGLTPGEHSSGERQRKGNISRQGNSRLRAILVECAWVAVRNDSHLGLVFTNLALRVGKKRAIVAVARKLVGIARSLFRKQTLYQTPVRCAA